MSIWRKSRADCAPSDTRNANSRRRFTAELTSKFDTFTQAINSTNPTAPSNAVSTGRTSPTTYSCNGVSRAPELGYSVGYCRTSSSEIWFISANACFVETPSFSRPIARRCWQARQAYERLVS